MIANASPARADRRIEENPRVDAEVAGQDADVPGIEPASA
jgi:hypothetical protein